ncbi:hypothetical protein PIB30_041367 [Stylosanthes scabra]|uniref:Uncharacterized protein n=1 Tax=Stylosanthes scabra TaxID=79078 RepID=A0ABU6ZDL6_9FABA|nr:hypothetical protein [Stylosanthes scabra]
MKPSLLIALSYFFLLFTLSTKLPLALSDNNNNKPLPVGAIGGGGPYVRIGEAFYIFPDYPPEDSQGGGLILGQTSGQTMKNSTTKCSCPLTVLQNHYDAELNGLPIHFTIPPSSPQPHYSTNSTDDYIVYTNTSLDITFIHKPINCAKSLKWIVVVDHDFPYPYIGVGGDHDKDYYSGKKIVNGAFHIQDLGDDNYREYNIVFCPTSSSSLGGCKYIGRYKNDVLAKRLILTDKDPFQVVFFRV